MHPSFVRLASAILLLVAGALATPVSLVTAQDASPEAGTSLLAGLGLPTLEVTVTADGIQAPAEIAAGPVLLVVTNQTDMPVLVDLAQFSGEATVEGYLAIGESDDGAIPAWAADLVVAGSASTPPMGTGSIGLNLAPGEWTIVVDTEEPGTQLVEPSAAISVTGEAPAGTEIAADLDLEFGEYIFSFPETIAAGPQVWHVTNVHTVPHHAVVFPVDRLYTADEVHNGVMAEFSGTPADEGFSFATSIVGPPIDLPVITAGQEVWLEANLAPGYYVAICFVADPGSDVPHVMQGMTSSFEVTAP